MTSQRNTRRRHGGFTLMELLVVIGVIGLAATLAVPSIAAFLTTGSDSQAVNYLSAICSAARTEAIRSHNHVVVHIQMEASYLGGSWKTNLDGRCYAMVMGYDKTSGTFRSIGQATDAAMGANPWPHRGQVFMPKPLPGGMAFGEYSPKFVSESGTTYTIINVTSLASMGDFTSVSILFTPSGSVARNAPSGTIRFSTADAVFGGAEPLWMADAANPGGTGEAAVNAVFLFKAAELAAAVRAGGTAPDQFVHNDGRRMAINNHTAQLFIME